MLDRRQFLIVSGSAVLPRVPRRGGIVLYAPTNTLAEESWRGYRRCLDFDSPTRVVIVPAFQQLSREQWTALREESGLVILESGLGFAGESEIARHAAGLETHFGIRIAGRSQPSGLRYIRYRWPVEVLVREFGGAVCVEGEAIAIVSGQVVAARRGNVIYLGSPLGPLLLAGDPQAQAWIRAVTRIR
jgi:hypothetical protein